MDQSLPRPVNIRTPSGQRHTESHCLLVNSILSFPTETEPFCISSIQFSSLAFIGILSFLVKFGSFNIVNLS